MAWEISHTEQAWANVRARLTREWDQDQLIEALEDAKEWGPDVNLHDLPHDWLVDEVMNCIREHNTCSNGGYEFYIDNEGWHSVSCSAPTVGTCGSCKKEVKLAKDNWEDGRVLLSCGCTEDEAVWSAEE